MEPSRPDPFTERSPRSSITLVRLEDRRALAPSTSRVEPDVLEAMFASEDCVLLSRDAASASLCPRSSSRCLFTVPSASFTTSSDVDFKPEMERLKAVITASEPASPISATRRTCSSTVL